MTREWNPQVYRESATLQWTVAQQLLAENLIFQGDESILDIGCGDGAITASIAECVPQGKVNAIDYSHKMIEHAKAAYPHQNLSFNVQSASEITAENQFDIVVSFSTLQWVKHLDRVISGIHRGIKKGGRVLLMFYPPLFFYIEMLDRVRRQPEWVKHFVGFDDGYAYHDVAELEYFLTQNNFIIHRIESVPRVWRYTSLDDYRLFVRGYAPHYRHLTEHVLQEKFLDDTCEQIMRYLKPATNGNLLVPFRTVECLAEK